MISLRDHFAAAALQGLLANSPAMTALQEAVGENFPHAVADRAYDLADAMIARADKPAAASEERL